MTRALRPLIAAIALTLWAVPTLAQTADEIIEKHLAATGGRAALAKLSSRVATGTIALTTPVGELKGTIEVSQKKPNKTRTLIKIDATDLPRLTIGDPDKLTARVATGVLVLGFAAVALAEWLLASVQ